MLFFLHWRTFHRPIAAKHTAIAGLRAEQSLAALTFVKKHAGIDRHGFFFLEPAVRAGDGGL
jgi:hypothetical protein